MMTMMSVFAVCLLEKDPGPCQASFYRWYFNSETGVCKEFAYGGCLGNGNRFVSKSECEERCDRLLVKKPVGRKCIVFCAFAFSDGGVSDSNNEDLSYETSRKKDVKGWEWERKCFYFHRPN